MGWVAINDRVGIRKEEVTFEFIRSSGPGGQNVNKVATAVRLRFNVMESPSLSEEVKSRLLGLVGRRVGTDGVLVITAQAERTQEANRRVALSWLIDLVRLACVRPEVRRPTRPTAGSQRRRLESKRAHARIKRERRGVVGEE
jgi:ribosome-associated protein